MKTVFSRLQGFLHRNSIHRKVSGQMKTDLSVWMITNCSPEIQEEVKKCWKAVTTDTVNQYCDIDGYWEDFYHMFGFHYSDIDYTQDVDANVEINGIVM